MRLLTSYGVAFLIIVAIAVWMGSGLIVQGGNGPGQGERTVVSMFNKDDAAPQSHAAEPDAEGPNPHLTIAERNASGIGEQAPARSVRIRSFLVQPMALEVPLRGRTEAKSIVAAVAETSGIVEIVSVTKGQKVEVGDLLCTLDQGTRASKVAEEEAGLARAQLDFDTNASLRAKGLATLNSKSNPEVALRSAQAALAQAQRELEKTEIRSKTAGVVQDPMTDVGALLSMGQPCATIAQLDPMIFTGEVPEIRIGLAKLGLPANIETVSGASAKGKVTYISSSANDATRSFPIEIEIPNADGKIYDGLTAQATVDLGSIPAHLLPQSVLTLDDEGVLGVRSVKDSIVEFHAINIASDTREGVWVLGLPPSIDIITVGQDFVKAGQTVNAAKAPDEATNS